MSLTTLNKITAEAKVAFDSIGTQQTPLTPEGICVDSKDDFEWPHQTSIPELSFDLLKRKEIQNHQQETLKNC
jgi:hypothetical protein